MALIRLATFAMGTRFELVLVEDDASYQDRVESRLRSVGEAAIEVIEECDRRLSLFRADSLLSFVNANAAERPVRLDQDTFNLFRLCVDVHRQSGGAFDVTVAPLMRLWGFHEALDVHQDDMHMSDRTLPQPLPHPSTPLRARREGGQNYPIELDDGSNTIRFRRDGIGLDLGAVGKGHAIDLAVDVLRENGITRALLHGGTSTAFAIGSPPVDDPDSPPGWVIGLKEPDGNTFDEPRISHHEYTVRLRDAALSVSAQHGRMITRNDQSVGHILDPRTGQPVGFETDHRVDLTAVIAQSAAEADAWSTALLVMGERPKVLPDRIATLFRFREGESGRSADYTIQRNDNMFRRHGSGLTDSRR